MNGVGHCNSQILRIIFTTTAKTTLCIVYYVPIRRLTAYYTVTKCTQYDNRNNKRLQFTPVKYSAIVYYRASA